MSRNYSYRRERRRGGMGCLAWLVVLVWVVLLGVLGYRFFLRPQISQILGSQIAGDGNPPAPASGPGGITDQVGQQAGEALPTVIAALPSGEIRVSEQQANEFLNSRLPKGVDKANVRFVQGEVQIDLTALGQTSTAHTGLAVQNGRVIAVNPRIEGLLGQLISLQDLTHSLEQQLNGQLAAQNRRVSNVQVGDGELVVNVE